MKNKKLAIYADSHGVCDVSGFPLSDSSKDFRPGWFEYLMNDYDITNYSQGGSSTYYSFNNFLNTHHLYDNVIFIASSPGRIDITLTDKRHMGIVPGFYKPDDFRHFNPNTLDSKKIMSAMDYMTYLFDEEKEHRLNNCMIREVMRIRPDTLFVPAFQSDIWPKEALPLSGISMMELAFYKNNMDTLHQGYWDLRKAHLSEEHNEILYKKVKKSLENSDKFAYFGKDEFVIPKKDKAEHYFKKTLSGEVGNIRIRG